MSYKHQKGSIEILAVMGIILILLVLIGYAVWNRTQTAQTTTTPTTLTQPESLETASINDAFGVKLGFSYPKNWTIDRHIEGPVPLSDAALTIEVITITSPSKDYSVVYRIGANGGFGGACSPDDSGKIERINVQKLRDFKNVNFIEEVDEQVAVDDGVPRFVGYSNFAGIAEADKTSDAKKGDSICKTYLSQTILLNEVNSVYLMDAQINIQGFHEAEKILTASDIAALYEKEKTAEYRTAKEILLSTTLR